MKKNSIFDRIEKKILESDCQIHKSQKINSIVYQTGQNHLFKLLCNFCAEGGNQELRAPPIQVLSLLENQLNFHSGHDLDAINQKNEVQIKQVCSSWTQIIEQCMKIRQYLLKLEDLANQQIQNYTEEKPCKTLLLNLLTETEKSPNTQALQKNLFQIADFVDKNEGKIKIPLCNLDRELSQDSFTLPQTIFLDLLQIQKQIAQIDSNQDLIQKKVEKEILESKESKVFEKLVKPQDKSSKDDIGLIDLSIKGSPVYNKKEKTFYVNNSFKSNSSKNSNYQLPLIVEKIPAKQLDVKIIQPSTLRMNKPKENLVEICLDSHYEKYRDIYAQIIDNFHSDKNNLVCPFYQGGEEPYWKGVVYMQKITDVDLYIKIQNCEGKVFTYFYECESFGNVGYEGYYFMVHNDYKYYHYHDDQNQCQICNEQLKQFYEKLNRRILD